MTDIRIENAPLPGFQEDGRCWSVTIAIVLGPSERITLQSGIQ
jgi:hypothetical protein